jgi:Fe-S oxidoreductase
LRAALAVLKRMGVEFESLFEEEPCCAGPLYYFGYQEEFGNRAAAAHRIFQTRGVKKIITIVPSCTFTLRECFPKFVKEWGMEVRHFVAAALKLSFLR